MESLIIALFNDGDGFYRLAENALSDIAALLYKNEKLYHYNERIGVTSLSRTIHCGW